MGLQHFFYHGKDLEREIECLHDPSCLVCLVRKLLVTCWYAYEIRRERLGRG